MLYFGTDGIRATTQSIFFSPEILCVLGKALALWNVQTQAHRTKKVLCIYDTRASATAIVSGLHKGLAALGHTMFNGGILPTPAAHWIMKEDNQFDFAVIITASHNPASDNGIKILLPNAKITEDDEQSIEKHFTNLLLRQPKSTAELTHPTNELVPFQKEAKTLFLEQIFASVPQPNLLNKTIGIDCANGSIGTVISELLARTNATVLCYNNQPNGYNINENCGATHPKALCNAVIKDKLDIAFAFDGDGDRVLCINKNGQVKTGDDILCGLLAHPKFKNTTTIVGTIMSNEGFSRYLTGQGKKLVRSAIGDRAIIAQMQEFKTSLGGEPGGHILINPGISSSDGASAMLWLLDSCLSNNNFSLTTFEPDIQITNSITAVHKPDFFKDIRYKEALASIEKIIPGGRSCVRYSGTEPLLRITIEYSEEQMARQALTLLTATLQQIIT